MKKVIKKAFKNQAFPCTVPNLTEIENMLGFENFQIISTKFDFIHLIPATLKSTSFSVSEIIDCKFLD